MVVLTALASGAQAQYFGGTGGSTIAGDYLRGLGFAATGMGIYNEKTAIANSINLDTFIRWNEYMAAVANEQRKEYVERRMYLSARNKEMNDKIEDRIHNHPEAHNVMSGDALAPRWVNSWIPRFPSRAIAAPRFCSLSTGSGGFHSGSASAARTFR